MALVAEGQLGTLAIMVDQAGRTEGKREDVA
jgi:hypothetical protein